MTNFQLKIVTGLLFSLAVCSGVLLFLPEQTSQEVKVDSHDLQVVKVEQKSVLAQQDELQKQVIETTSTKDKTLASAADLDAFFNEIEGKTKEPATEAQVIAQKPIVENEPKAVLFPNKKPSKLVLTADNLLSKNYFSQSLLELRNSFQYKFRSGQISVFPKVQSIVFPGSTKSIIDYDKDGLKNVRLNFHPKSYGESEDSWKAVWLNLQDNLNEKFACDFKWETRADGSVLGKSQSDIGLLFFATYHCPDSINREKLSYITLSFGTDESKMRVEPVKEVFKDTEFRALANYYESKVFVSRSSIDLASIKSQISNFWRENQLKNKDLNYFYTDIEGDNPFELKIADRAYPKIRNFIGRDTPDKAIYHRWTTVDGLVKKIDIVTNEKVVPLYQIWHKNNLPVFSVQYTGSKNSRFYYLHEYDRGSLIRIVKLNHKSSTLALEELSRVVNSQLLTFNKNNRLINAILRVNNDYFTYSEESKYRESSFSYGKREAYYGAYTSSSISGVHLRGVFSRSLSSTEVSGVWDGIHKDEQDNRSLSLIKEVRSLLGSGKGNWLLAYRDKKSESPIMAQRTGNSNETVSVSSPEKAVVSPTAVVSANNLEEFIKSPELFKAGVRDFEANIGKFGAVWTDKLKRSARSRTPQKISKVVSTETLFNFRKGKLNKLTLMLYNKGDQDRIRKSDFIALQDQAIKSVLLMFGMKLNYKPNAGLAKNHLYWCVTKNHLIKLESNFTETKKSFSAEYIRLTFTPALKGLNAVNIDRISSDILTNEELLSMVSKDKNGAVYISGIPMVDQGQKGYCACAATARILNYYGKDIDQHEIAKLALSTSMGTGPDELKKALGLISTKLRLHFQTVVKCFLSNDNDIKRFFVKLERAYKKEGYLFNSRSLKVDELSVVFSNMADKEARYRDFKKGIIRSINSGRPLAWALCLGIVPEPEIPQASGGHMRLIIGYNETTEQIYYSDTWGAGHERKVMDMKSAFWISAALWELRPR